MNEEELNVSPLHKGAATAKNTTPLKERFSNMGSTSFKMQDKRSSVSQNVKEAKDLNEIERTSMEKGSLISEKTPLQLFSNEFTLEELQSAPGYATRRFPDAIYYG